MGQPPVWQPYAAAMGVVAGQSSDGQATLLGGVYHSITNPVSGILGVSGEGYFSAGQIRTGGARLLATSPLFATGIGVDLDLRTGDLDPVVSYRTAIRRGGLLGHGTMLRLDWHPTRGQQLSIGLHVPLLQPLAGKTRPQATGVQFTFAGPSPPASPVLVAPATTAALKRAAASATLISAYTNLYTKSSEGVLFADATRDYTGTLRTYRSSLAEAFTDAVGDSALGARLEAAGRAIVLDAVLLPYDSTFGEAKADDDIDALIMAGRGRFGAWLRDSSRLSPQLAGAAASVFTSWLEIVGSVHHDLLSQWKDSRLVWLPLQLGLAPEQYDDQAEVDALIARAVGRPFTDQNALAYLNSTELPLEIARSIYATRDYHVLWMHDFAGRRPTGSLDNIGYSMVADVYFPALIQAVARYDSTGRMPVYMILLDQYFYEPNDGRLWMTILEDPLHASVRLRGDSVRQAHLEDRQRELRAAVAASPRLQRDAAAGIDLSSIVKVHVSITHPADFSFRSSRIIPPIPFTPDNLMRDHRKIAFYDLNEADPYRGAMILMGVGIGEHYASPTWEDRGYRIRGPAALEARAALRRNFLRMGFREDQIPLPLRATASAPAAEKQMNLGDYVGRALQVYNEVGFGAKRSSVARAMLYNLAAPGSVIISPDPLWLSRTWAGMLSGAAARGSRVFIIAPALANAPSPQPPLMALSHELMLRLVNLSKRLAAQPSANDGELRIGIFAATAQVNDPAGRAREIREGLARAPWIQSVIPFDSTTLAVLANVEHATANDGQDATTLAHDEKPRAPQLHQKTQLIALPGALAALARLPGWESALAQSIRQQSQQTSKFTEQLGYMTPDVDTTAMRRNDELLGAYEESRPAAERDRVSFYFSVGTQNQDPRGIESDGEATIVVSGFHAAAGVIDLYNLMARSTWVTNQKELDKLLPAPTPFWLRIARVIRAAL
jgi:phosphatidylserine/phosphatidylglycerophosphate/cardiolipin synthase-like enzyme